MQQYDFLALQSFVAVVESGSFSKAAEQLGASTAAVSRRISGLEQQLGLQLLRRTTRRIDLTEAGQQFYGDVLNVFLLLDEAEERVRAGTERVSGLMRVAAPMSFGIQKLAAVLPAFMQRHPDLKIQLLLEDRYTDLVAEGIDVAVRIGHLADSSLVARRVGSIERVFCAAPAYLHLQGEPEKPEELAGHACLQYAQRGPREDWSTILGAPDTLELNVSLIANNGEVLKECAIQGMGVALLPAFVVEDALADGRLCQILGKFSPAPFGLYAVRQSSRLIPARVRLFIEYLNEVFGD